LWRGALSIPFPLKTSNDLHRKVAVVQSSNYTAFPARGNRAFFRTSFNSYGRRGPRDFNQYAPVFFSYRDGSLSSSLLKLPFPLSWALRARSLRGDSPPIQQFFEEVDADSPSNGDFIFFIPLQSPGFFLQVLFPPYATAVLKKCPRVLDFRFSPFSLIPASFFQMIGSAKVVFCFVHIVMVETLHFPATLRTFQNFLPVKVLTGLDNGLAKLYTSDETQKPQFPSLEGFPPLRENRRCQDAPRLFSRSIYPDEQRWPFMLSICFLF